MHTHIFLDIYFLHLPLEGQARQEEAKGFHILFKRETIISITRLT